MDLSQNAIEVGKSNDAKLLFRVLCWHLLGSGVHWEKAVGAVEYLNRNGVLWLGEPDRIEKGLNDCNYGNPYLSRKNASLRIYENRQLYYTTGSIVTLVRLLEALCNQDPFLARNVLAGHNREKEIHVMGTDIRLKNMYIKGLRMKWASHFLRELGFSHNELAILDRHILEYLVCFGLISSIPKNLSPKVYMDIERKMKEWASNELCDIPLDHLDWVLWDMGRSPQCF